MSKFCYRPIYNLQNYLIKEKEALSEAELYKHSKWIEPPREGVTKRRK
jgi:hypothetical protein